MGTPPPSSTASLPRTESVDDEFDKLAVAAQERREMMLKEASFGGFLVAARAVSQLRMRNQARAESVWTAFATRRRHLLSSSTLQRYLYLKRMRTVPETLSLFLGWRGLLLFLAASAFMLFRWRRQLRLHYRFSVVESYVAKVLYQ